MGERGMSSDYDRAANESRPWAPVLGVLGFRQIELATDDEDWGEATDMVARIRFALRTRNLYPGRPDYLQQFTIRWKRTTGALTEKDKMLEGNDWPDYKGYGFRSPDGLEPWVILRVANLRRLHKSGELEAAREGKEKRNTDKKQSVFRAFRLPQLVRADPDLVWKASPKHPGIPVTQAPTPSRHSPLSHQIRMFTPPARH